MAIEIRVLQIAQQDMKSIVEYIRLDNPDAAVRMLEKIKNIIGALANAPQIGAVPLDNKIAEQGYRMLVVEHYLIFYLFFKEECVVEIHRVIHGKRNYAKLF